MTNSELKTIDEVVKTLEETLQKIKELKATKEPKKDDAKVEKAVPRKIAFSEVRAVLADISRDGKTAQVKALLHKYNANKLSEVAEESYEALMSEAEALANGN